MHLSQFLWRDWWGVTSQITNERYEHNPFLHNWRYHTYPLWQDVCSLDDLISDLSTISVGLTYITPAIPRIANIIHNRFFGHRINTYNIEQFQMRFRADLIATFFDIAQRLNMQLYDIENAFVRDMDEVKHAVELEDEVIDSIVTSIYNTLNLSDQQGVSSGVNATSGNSQTDVVRDVTSGIMAKSRTNTSTGSHNISGNIENARFYDNPQTQLGLSAEDYSTGLAGLGNDVMNSTNNMDRNTHNSESTGHTQFDQAHNSDSVINDTTFSDNRQTGTNLDNSTNNNGTVTTNNGINQSVNTNNTNNSVNSGQTFRDNNNHSLNTNSTITFNSNYQNMDTPHNETNTVTDSGLLSSSTNRHQQNASRSNNNSSGSTSVGGANAGQSTTNNQQNTTAAGTNTSDISTENTADQTTAYAGRVSTDTNYTMQNTDEIRRYTTTALELDMTHNPIPPTTDLMTTLTNSDQYTQSKNVIDTGSDNQTNTNQQTNQVDNQITNNNQSTSSRGSTRDIGTNQTNYQGDTDTEKYRNQIRHGTQKSYRNVYNIQQRVATALNMYELEIMTTVIDRLSRWFISTHVDIGWHR